MFSLHDLQDLHDYFVIYYIMKMTKSWSNDHLDLVWVWSQLKHAHSTREVLLTHSARCFFSMTTLAQKIKFRYRLMANITLCKHFKNHANSFSMTTLRSTNSKQLAPPSQPSQARLRIAPHISYDLGPNLPIDPDSWNTVEIIWEGEI